MKEKWFVLIVLSISCQLFSQEQETLTKENLLKELADNGCKCVDSVHTYDKSNEEVVKGISDCIDRQVGAYQLGAKLLQLTPDLTSKKKKDVKNIDVKLNAEVI